MKNYEIQKVLNELWEGKIQKIDFDIIKNRICLEVEVLDSGLMSKYKVELLDVSSYYFVNNIGEERKSFVPFENGDFLELSSISLISGNVDIIPVTEEKWIEQYYSKTNLAIEIWSRYLFVEVDVLSVNGKHYKLTT